MNTIGIVELLNNNEDKIKSKEFILNILNMQNNLICYDFLSRILIELQCEKAFDVRTQEEWLAVNRSIKSGANPIWIVLPIYEKKYVYSDNENKDADIHDMNIIEKNKAIELNIIKRKESISDIKIQAVYDIRQTSCIEDTQFEVGKPILNHKELLRIFEDITKCTIEITDEFYYSTSENILFIPKVEYKTFANMIAIAFQRYFLDYIELPKYSEEQLENLKKYIEITLTTLFRGKHSVQIEDAIDIKDYIQIIGIVDGIVERIINKINYKGQFNLSSSAIQSIGVLKKAEVVVDLLTAVYTNKKLINT